MRKINWLHNACRLVDKENPEDKYSQIIKRVEKFFNIKMRVVVKKNSTMWGFIHEEDPNDIWIEIGDQLSVRDATITIVHEGIHQAWNLDHDDLSRKANFRSYGDNDYFSEVFTKLIFGREP